QAAESLSGLGFIAYTSFPGIFYMRFSRKKADKFNYQVSTYAFHHLPPRWPPKEREISISNIKKD
uniref:hypothetical protein n=1 Tax=Aerococcus urinaeequi TaxID=51665 RepID=UPI00352AFFF4